MERLLVVQLQATGCAAEVLLNGVVLARLDGAAREAMVPAHEYTLAGGNRLALQVSPCSPAVALPAESDPVPAAAVARVLLPRMGQPIHADSARTLAQLDWGGVAGETSQQSQDLNLPVSFPRWRWLDAPPAQPTPALQAAVLAWLRGLAASLAAGQPEPFIEAVRLRTEELALAYQRPGPEQTQRLRAHLLQLHAQKALNFKPLDDASLVLRPLAGGRLLDCLGAQGQPALCTLPDAQGQTHAFPLRIAVVEGLIHVLR